MSLGTAVLVTALLGGWAVSHALGQAAHREAQRQPAYSLDTTSTFLLRQIPDSVGTRPLTRIVVALPPGSRAGRVNPAWAPPGCSTLPSAGASCLSPALARLAAHRPLLAQRLGIADLRAAEVMTNAGVRDPSELVIYQGVPARQLPAAAHAAGWGAGVRRVEGGVSASTALLEMALLVGIPAFLLLGVCARLSSATRVRRTRALVVLGLSRRELGFVAALEGRIGGLLGALIALLCYRVGQPALANCGMAGFRWFAADCRLAGWAALMILVIVPLVVGRFCRTGAVRISGAPTRRVNVGPASLWRLAPLWLAIMTLSGYLILRSERRFASAGAVVVVVAGGIAAAGLVLAVRPLAELGAAAVARRTRFLPVRLGARRIEAEATSTVRVLTAVVVLVLTACIGSAVLRDASLAAGPRSATELLSVSAADLPTAGDRQAVLDIASIASAASVRTPLLLKPGQPVSTDPGAADIELGVPITFASCTDLRRLEPTLASDCVDGWVYRTARTDPSLFPNDLPIGQRVTVPTATAPLSLAIPREVLRFGDLGSGLVDTNALVVTKALDGGWPASATLVAETRADDSAISAFQDALARISTSAHADLQGQNLDALAEYRVHSGLLRFGVGLGFSLGVVAFLVAVVDRLRERRRAVALLLAVGAGRSTIRSAQAIELVGPALVGLSAAAVIGFLIGSTYLATGNLQHGIYWPMLGAGAVLAGIGTAAVGLAGLLARFRINPSDLRSE
jgi:hypothetical protein